MGEIIDIPTYNFDKAIKDCIEVIQNTDITTEEGKGILINEIFKAMNEHSMMIIKLVNDFKEYIDDGFRQVGDKFGEQDNWNKAMQNLSKTNMEYQKSLTGLISTFVENQTRQ